jgi:hypothetical protein
MKFTNAAGKKVPAFHSTMMSMKAGTLITWLQM